MSQYDIIPKTPRIITIVSSPSYIRQCFELIRNLLALLGLLVIVIILFLYHQGQWATRGFDERFIDLFSKFIEQTLNQDVASALIIKIPLELGITNEQAIQAMQARATQLNMKLLANYRLHDENRPIATKPMRFTTILEFYTENATVSLLNHNADFATYLPYRVVLYQDMNGKLWIAMLNLELLIYGSQQIDNDIKTSALTMQDNLLKIMNAGASGMSI